jgi:hypothetical protein
VAEQQKPAVRTDFWLSEFLGERKKAGRGYKGLAQAISACAPQREGPADVIDRRKLQRIVEGKKEWSLGLKELRVLDRYLEQCGQPGLAQRPIFSKPDIMDSLGESGRVSFLIGSTPDPDRGRRNMAHWDVLAAAEIQRAVNTHGASVRFDLHEVPTRESSSDTRELLSDLMAESGPSLVCAGSSRTNTASELMLSEMFGCQPFPKVQPDERHDLPFYFVWNDQLSYLMPSHFRLQTDRIGELGIHPEQGDPIESGEGSGIATRGRLFVDRITPGGWGDAYGLCVAQRRKRGQVWLVLAGVSGAATFAASRLIRQLPPGDEMVVTWAIVGGHIAKGTDAALSSARVLQDEGIVYGPESWPRSPA